MSNLGQADILASHNQDPLGMFQFAIRAEETKRQYMSKLKAFFDFVELKGDVDEQATQFVILTTTESNAALSWLMRFISFQKERVARREITEATLRNYCKPIKVFCKTNDMLLNWRKLTSGVPKFRKLHRMNANQRGNHETPIS